MSPAFVPILVFVFLFPSTLAAQGISKTLENSIIEAHGTAQWSGVERVKFTFTHAPSGTSRTHDWNRKAGSVTVSVDGKEITIPTHSNTLEGEKLEAHKAFINDTYWLLFEHFMVRDTATRSFERAAQLPGAEGPVDALRIAYPSTGGYTPGDVYVLYLKDGQAKAWAYHPSGSDSPRLVTTRAGWKEFEGLRVPTVFDTMDGERFITLSEVEISF